MHTLIDSANFGSFLDNDDLQARPRRRLSLGAMERLTNETVAVPAIRRRIALDLTSPDAEIVTIGREKFDLSAVARRVLDFLATADAQPFAAIVTALETHANEEGIRDAVRELARFGLVGLGSKDSG